MRVVLLLAALTTTATAQWTLQTTNTTADLRGIDNVGHGIAWASGTNGTVLHTTDNGTTWLRCPTPPNAEALDFRGIQAFDAQTAIVMSSGKGDLSRLYKTTDGCQTWKLVFTNPDQDGFWDAIMLNRFDKDGEILGDPVDGKFSLWETDDKGETWIRSEASGHEALTEEGAFAASNSSLSVDEANSDRFISGGPKGSRVFVCGDNGHEGCHAQLVPLGHQTATSGGFSIGYRDYRHWAAVGGDYTKPLQRSGTAIHTFNEGRTWQQATTPPHGYRSAVAYDAPTKTWITVGPNGTDISTDDGRNWRPLKPSGTDAPDADQHWNALSLPFVVGPHGRIGMLEPTALKPTPTK